MGKTNKRKAVSTRTRFEIFKRDSFKCQYCGRGTPSVVLEIDHIISVKEGGDNDIQNLITSCFECNRGKSGIPLDKIKIRDDLSEDMAVLVEKEEQLKEYRKLQKRIERRIKKDIAELADYWSAVYDYEQQLKPKTINGFKQFLSVLSLVEIYGVDKTKDLITETFSQSRNGYCRWLKETYLDG